MDSRIIDAIASMLGIGKNAIDAKLIIQTETIIFFNL